MCRRNLFTALFAGFFRPKPSTAAWQQDHRQRLEAAFEIYSLIVGNEQKGPEAPRCFGRHGNLEPGNYECDLCGLPTREHKVAWDIMVRVIAEKIRMAQ
jgi:hypothetical protein